MHGSYFLPKGEYNLSVVEYGSTVHAEPREVFMLFTRDEDYQKNGQMSVTGTALNQGNSNLKVGTIKDMDSDYFDIAFSKFNKYHDEMLYYKVLIFQGDLLS